MKKKFMNDLKIAYVTNYIKMIIDTFLAYEKHYDITKQNFNHMVKESKDSGFILTDEEIDLVKENVKWYLRVYHGIDIVKENPIETRKVKPYHSFMLDDKT